MPNRILRDGILTSMKLASLGWGDEVLYRRLMSVADDYGRFHAHPSLIRAACYPLQLSKVSDADIGKWLQALESAGLVSVYPAKDGNRYLAIDKFGQQVRALKSKFPDPIADASKCEQVLADAHVGVSAVVSVSAVGDGPEPAAPPPAFTIPLNTGKDHGVTDAQVREYAALYPAVDVPAELRKMRGWALANPQRRKTSRGIAAFIAAWLAREQDKGGRGVEAASTPLRNTQGPSPRKSREAEKAMEREALAAMEAQFKEIGIAH